MRERVLHDMRPRAWLPAEDEALLEMRARRCRLADIERALGRARGSPEERLRRLLRGAYAVQPDPTPWRAMAMLGVCQSVFRGWIAAGWLPTRPAGRTARVIPRAALEAFLADERHWHRWTPTRIADPGLRAWTTELRAGVEWIGTAEAARRMGYASATVTALCTDGRLSAERRGRKWMLRADRLQLAPAAGRKPKRARLSGSERALIRRLWGAVTATEIGARLCCTNQTVGRYARVMGLPRLGPGFWRLRARRDAAYIAGKPTALMRSLVQIVRPGGVVTGF